MLAIYYYVILNGGTVSLSLLYSNVELLLTATLLISLALLELSAEFRMLQGLLEMRERPQTANQVQAPMPAARVAAPK